MSMTEAAGLSGSLPFVDGNTGFYVMRFVAVNDNDHVYGNRLYDTDGRPLTETVPMLRRLHLFNVAQCDGLPEHMQPPQADDGADRPVEDYAVVSPERLAGVQRMLEATGVQMEARMRKAVILRRMITGGIPPGPKWGVMILVRQ
ncbi:hypothetical protein ACQUWL_18035 [Serratia marcescens]|uniref:hypothetical protein n=1 Tax=Serratia marcescens TaxID=615 RepID=UPI003D17F7B7